MAELLEQNGNNAITLVFDALRTICNNNIQFFASDKSENGKQFSLEFVQMLEYADQLEPFVKQVDQVANLYDYDEKIPGNGFRSFVIVINASVTFSMQICNKICLKRDSILFRKNKFIREIKSCNDLLNTLCTTIQHVITLTKWCPTGDLFVAEEHSPEELLSKAEEINQYCFYGRCLGFQFCESLRSILKFLSLSMVIFSEAYYNTGSFLYKATNSMLSSGKYVLDPEIRARRIVNISQNSDVDFCKSYWLLSESEIMLRLPSLLSSSVAISHVISIPPVPLQYEKKNGDVVEIPIPSAHLGPKHLPVRLISHSIREGMIGVANSRRNILPPSPCLIVHCHGGGFVAQSSRSHEIYLRDWAQQLDVPILSVDYSLAPEAPFPRAVEEVFYAYCWAVKHCSLLGSTGKKLVLVGDSAGGNLLLGAALKCIELDVRTPDGIFLAYVPLLVEFNPSPSRLLCVMDPLLPFGFMMRCLKAYACTDFKPSQTQNQTTSSDTESFEEVSESDLLELQAHKSPVSESSDTLTNVSLSSQPVSTKSIKIEDEETKEHVTEFLDKYVLDSDTDSDGAKVRLVQTGSKQQSQLDQTLHQRFTGFVGALTNRISRWNSKPNQTPAELYLDSDRQKSLVEEFKFVVPRNPYLSPYWAKDDILKCLPAVRILTVELDPCLDDCVMFAKKLKRLKNDVDLDVLPGLCHGFLNFSAICKEAHNGSKKCVERIKELLAVTSDSQGEN